LKSKKTHTNEIEEKNNRIRELENKLNKLKQDIILEKNKSNDLEIKLKKSISKTIHTLELELESEKNCVFSLEKQNKKYLNKLLS
jgi:hypothetical protein